MKLTRHLFPENITFRRQLIMSVAIGAICVALGAATLTAVFSNHMLRNDAITNSINITNNVARQSVLALLYGSTDVAKETASIALAFPHVIYVAIYDTRNVLLSQLGAQPADTGSKHAGNLQGKSPAGVARNKTPGVAAQAELIGETDEAWTFTAPIYTEASGPQEEPSPFSTRTHSREQLGHVLVTVSKSGLKEIQHNLFWQNVATSLIFSALLLLVLKIIINRLTHPLHVLSRIMHESESGQKGLRAELQGTHEIVSMAHAFNSMMAALDERDQNLREHRDLLESQVEVRTRELKLARDQALQASRHKSEFLANISHELRTPMNAVIGYTDILIEELEDEGDEGKVSDLKRIQVAGQHLLSLINSVLDLTKIEAGRMDLQPRSTDIALLVQEASGILQPMLKKNNNQLYIDVENLDQPVMVDAEKLKQVLLNLLSNANKFTHDGTIRIHAQRADGTLYLSVSDTGIGIPQAQHEHIFEAFRQADMSTTRTYGGTGLGLTISRHFCRLMGGDISVHSTPGEGACFRLHIPLPAHAPTAA